MSDIPAPAECEHEWQIGKWGVVIGLSRCRLCGKVARREDFPVLATLDKERRDNGI